jgi:hypothetical protein
MLDGPCFHGTTVVTMEAISTRAMLASKAWIE